MNWPRLCSRVPDPPSCNVIQPLCRLSRMMPLSNVPRQVGRGNSEAMCSPAEITKARQSIRMGGTE